MSSRVGNALVLILKEDTIRASLGDDRFTDVVLEFLMETRVGYVEGVLKRIENVYVSVSCVRRSFGSPSPPFFPSFFLFFPLLFPFTFFLLPIFSVYWESKCTTRSLAGDRSVTVRVFCFGAIIS